MVTQCISLVPGDLFAYLPIPGAVILLVLFLIVVAFIASRMLNRPEWEAYAYVELSELFISVLIIGAAFAIFSFSDMFACGIAEAYHPITDPGEASGYQFRVAASFLQNNLYNGVLAAMKDVYFIQVFFSMYNTMFIRPSDAVWTVTYKLFPSADSIVSLTNTLTMGMSIAYASIAAQLLILAVSNAVMFQLVLPAGIILRIFPPTRKAGMFLICFAIAFQAVFPLTYVLHERIVGDVWLIEKGAEEPEVPHDRADYLPYEGTSGQLYGFLLQVYTQASAAKVVSEAIPIPVFRTVVGMFASEAGAYTFTMAWFRPILTDIANLALVSIFLPAFSTLITFSFMNALFNRFMQQVS